MSSPVRWECPTLDPSQLNQDPVQAEFFTDKLVGHNLVREALQNALDERVPENTGPVEVRFTIRSGERALAAKRAARYLDGLHHHLDLCRATYPDEVDREQLDMAAGKVDMPYLLIEDFNTRGLCGDVEQTADVPVSGGGRNNFYWFFRNSGRSGKLAEDAGSWGVGKTVFQDLSQVNANFALTVRYDDARHLLMGQTLLKTHQEHSDDQVKRYAAYGYWAGELTPGCPYMPVADPALISDFVSDFNLTRSDEPGLSVIVPFPHGSVTGKTLLRGVLVSYFRPIVTQRLVVVIDDNGTSLRLAEANDLLRAVDEIDLGDAEYRPDELRQLFETVEDLETLPPEQTITLSDPEISTAKIPDDVVKEMRDRFDAGHLLRVQVPQAVKKRDRDAETDRFDIVLKNDPDGRNRRPYYVRDQLSLSENGPRSSHPASALVVVEKGALAELLRASENPAHQSWQSSKRDRLRLWPQGSAIVRHVNNSVNQLLNVLFGASNQKRPDALINFFQKETDEPERTKKPRRRRRSPDDPPPPPPSPVPFYKYDRLDEGGVRVYGNPKSILDLRPISFRFAYDREVGDALKNYSSFDFDMNADIKIVPRRATYAVTGTNEVRIDPEHRDFEVRLTGFGVDRDLHVRSRVV